MTTLTNPNDAPQTNETWQLNALSEALGDLTLTVSDSLSVGRGSDNDVVLGSKQVSRNHAVLSVLDGQLYVKDLDSSNGTFINEKRVEGNQSIPVQVADTIGFASFNFQVQAPAASTHTAESAPTNEQPEQTLTATSHTETVTPEPAIQQPVTAPSTEEDVKTPIDEPVVADIEATKAEHEVKAEERVAATRQDTAQPIPAEGNKTTKTSLQEEADPEVLRAKQAATAQFSGTANLGKSRDLGTQGNNAMDQAIDNPANEGRTEKKPSGGWFIWVFVALIIIGLALWLFNMGSV